jgi:hypothetical protein
MSTSWSRFSEFERRQALRRVRTQAALVRALLGELDGVTSSVARSPKRQHGTSEQVAEEVARLACRMLECAAAMTGEDDAEAGASLSQLIAER